MLARVEPIQTIPWGRVWGGQRLKSLPYFAVEISALALATAATSPPLSEPFGVSIGISSKSYPAGGYYRHKRSGLPLNTQSLGPMSTGGAASNTTALHLHLSRFDADSKTGGGWGGDEPRRVITAFAAHDMKCISRLLDTGAGRTGSGPARPAGGGDAGNSSGGGGVWPHRLWLA